MESSPCHLRGPPSLAPCSQSAADIPSPPGAGGWMEGVGEYNNNNADEDEDDIRRMTEKGSSEIMYAL